MSIELDKTSVLIIGDGQTATLCSHALINRGRGRFRLAGVVPPSRAPAFLRPFVQSNGASVTAPHRVVVALDDRRGRLPLEELVALRFEGVKVEEASSFLEEFGEKVPVRNVQPSDLAFSSGFEFSRWKFWCKTVGEWFLALFLLALVSPLLGIAALTILLDDGRPVLFRQERVGLRGRRFRVFKLRTMVRDAEKAGPQFARDNDNRVTRIGRILRRTRIDELPQLLNVLRGEMSLIGPRPERPGFVAGFTELIPYFTYRHSVRPGITGWAQVSYGYTDDKDGSLEKLSYDLYYIKHFSFLFDIRIVLATVGTVIKREGR